MDLQVSVCICMRQPQATRLKRAAPLSPPEKPKEDECCKLDCPNCVLLVYQVGSCIMFTSL